MKKKVIRLTESEVIFLVKKIIKENFEGKIRRRIHEIQDILDMLVAREDPEDYNDEFEYADNILYAVNDDLVEKYPDMDNYHEEIMDYLKDTYAQSLFDIWYDATDSEDEDEEYED